jgi:serine/threonine protein kinase/tetratricopeptide (TPR) repeat protein
MEKERFDQVKRLFQEAIQKDPSERAGFLDGLGAADPELRKEIESRLAAYSKDSFLEKTPPGVDSITVDKPTAIRTPSSKSDISSQIGSYKILREIGEGGMGIVYEAEQQKPVHRKVALKLIKWGMDTRAVIGRFESERQALALMSHPNIASVYDAGAAGSGRPYFAMEYVQGIPITEYCDKHRLMIRERLVLFIQVCEGIQHAHQKGIIHRDIKPSNVLVAIQDNKPIPKIIDFGVAKATSQRLTEHTVYTELGQLIGTPEYMSPEQAEMTNLDIDTRTDVYSLGVLLYELLVGSQPFDSKKLREAGLMNIHKKLREEEPPKPSTRVSRLGEDSTTSASNRRVEIRILERQLRGDLDWITMKALEKDRTRRYETANGLAVDVQRYLSSEPVAARPPSPMYRLEKFVRRHRAGVAAAGIVALALVLGIAGTTVGLFRARTAERAAVQEAATAKAINEFLQETLGSANPLMGLGRDTTVLEALDHAVDEIDASFAEQPEIDAAVRATIGLTYLRLGRFDEAEPLLMRALEIRQRIFGDKHIDTAESFALMGLLLTNQAKWDEAAGFTRNAVRLAGELGEQGKNLWGDAMLNLAGLAADRGDLEDAESMYREVLAMWEKADSDFGPAWVRHNLAGVLYKKGDYEEAETLFREALEGFRKTRGNEYPMVASTLHGLGKLIARLNAPTEVQETEGDCEGALPLFLEALEINLGTVGPSDLHTASVRGSYGTCLARLGRYLQAEQQLLDSLASLRAGRDDDQEATAEGVRRLVRLYEAWGQPEKADEYRAMLAESKGQNQ